ncbi:hypothetical protein K0M31_019553, partial [Melipona bicolor]
LFRIVSHCTIQTKERDSELPWSVGNEKREMKNKVTPNLRSRHTQVTQARGWVTRGHVKVPVVQIESINPMAAAILRPGE